MRGVSQIPPELTLSNTRSYTRVMPLPTSELVALQRSAAMLTPSQQQPVDRDVLIELCAELVESRQLLARLGADLRTVAQRSRQS